MLREHWIANVLGQPLMQLVPPLPVLTLRALVFQLPQFMHYNFVKIHMSLKVTPAMAAGVTTRLWEISDIVALLDA